MYATFLPWFKVPIIGFIDGTQGNGYGWETFILYFIPLLIYLTSKQSEPVNSTKITIAVTTSIVASILGLSNMIKFYSKMNGLNSENPFAKALTESVSIEVGLYLVVIAGIGVTIAILFIEDPTEPNIIKQISSPPKPNDIIKIKIKKQQTLGTFLLVLQSIIYLEHILNIHSNSPIRFDNDLSCLYFNSFLIIAILPFIRVNFLSRKLNDDNENKNSDSSALQTLPINSPITEIHNSNPHTEKISKLKELKELLDAGILNQLEYDTQKAKILS